MSLISAQPVAAGSAGTAVVGRVSQNLRPVDSVDADANGDASALPAHEVECTVLTPSGTVVAKGRVAPRADDHLPEAYAIQLTQIEPPGVLEAMVYADQPTILLRYEGAAEARVRIDHITGPPPARAFFCQPA
ncbi:MAG: hypothetical protein F4Y94_10630 [Chloroflexi bacterium]|nr:hypothetical protein [Chloroflexota bacterium]